MDCLRSWRQIPLTDGVVSVHIPDGFLSTPVWVATDVTAVATVGFAVRKVREELDERKLPLLGLTAAFVFGAQTLNFPIPGGTSGHVMGGVLTALLVGPYAGVLVMSVVLILQALLFGDGGVLALGANIVNMALIGTWLCYGIYGVLRTRISDLVAAGVAAWLSLVLGAAGCGVMLALSGTAPFTAVVPLMVVIHAVIGIGEALVTVAAVKFVKQLRPEWVHR